MEIELPKKSEKENRLTVKFKILNKTVYLPKYQSSGAVGLDLQASENATIYSGQRCLVPTGLAIEIPDGYEGQIRPRSGLAAKHGITVLNSPGTIDPDYRGEIKVCLINHTSGWFDVKVGDRIAQLVICPVAKPEIVQVEELSDTDRGSNGFGSTGK
jgi:dUTP pyrophosphatase